MFLEADWEGFCHAGSAGNQSMAPLGVVFPNGVKNTLISAAKLGGFLQWGGPRWCAEFWWLVWSGNFMVVGESFGRHGWVGLGWMFVAGLHFFLEKRRYQQHNCLLTFLTGKNVSPDKELSGRIDLPVTQMLR